jgi:hypothetical protein
MRPYNRCVATQYVWIGESLVVMSEEELEELYRELSESAASRPLRASEAQVVNVRPEYL